MATIRSHELAESAEIADEQGNGTLADELRLLASYGDDSEEEDSFIMPVVRSGGTLLSDIEEDSVDWLWRNWLPLGSVTMFVGIGGTGKSTVTSDLIARVTRGDLMPDGTACETPGGAIVISLEEKTASVVVPRIRKAGANLSRVIDLSKVKRTVVSPGQPAKTPFMLPDDIENGVLEREVKRVNASLIVIDPLMSAVNPRVSTFRNQSARQVIYTFQEVAERLGIAVVIVNHFTKGSKKDPLDAMAGSRGFVDIVRSIMMLSTDASNPQHKVMSLLKHNLAPDVPQIVLEHDGVHVRYLDGVTPSQEKINEAAALARSRQCVLTILEDAPSLQFTPTELAQRCDVHYDSMKQTLRRMVADGQIINPARGFYQAMPKQNGVTSVTLP